MVILRKILSVLLLAMLILGAVEIIVPFEMSVFAQTETPPTNLTAIEMSMNASAFDWRARTLHVYNDTQYWMRWGLWDPIRHTGYQDSLESEAIAQFFLFDVLLYNLTRDPMAYERVIDMASTIKGEYQNWNASHPAYGGLWSDFNNATKRFADDVDVPHTTMALIGMSLLYNLTENAKWQNSANAMKTYCFDSGYDETTHCIREWFNGAWTAWGSAYEIGWYTAAMGAYCKYVGQNATLEQRAKTHYSWQMENNGAYITSGQVFTTGMEKHVYQLYGPLFCALAYDNDTYREIYTNGTQYIIDLMEANPEGNNGSIPFNFIANPTPEWNDPSTGLHLWAACQALYHMSVAYDWTGNSTIVTYINYLTDYLRRRVYPSGYWHFASGTGKRDEDITWSPSSAAEMLGTVQYALATNFNDHPFAVTSTVLVKDFAWFSDTSQLHFTAIDQWYEYNWFRYEQIYHQITFCYSSEPARIYQGSSIFTSWSYSNNILKLNFTLLETSQFNIYFGPVDAPHLITSEDAITSMTYANDIMTFIVHGGVRKEWTLGDNLFYDDFSTYATCTEASPTWIPDSAVWHVTDEDHYYCNSSSGSHESIINGSVYSNFRLDVDVKTGEDGAWQTRIRFQREDALNFYQLYTSHRYEPDTFSLQSCKEGSCWTMNSTDDVEAGGFPEPLTWYRFTVFVRENHIQVYVNGTKYFDVWDTWEGNLLEGNVSLATLAHNTHRFDSVNITEYISSSVSSTITQIYCGDKGQPKDVSGVSSWDYDSVTKILTLTVINTGPAAITISWVTGLVAATIDVDPKTVNLKSKGKGITAHIELPEECDVNDIAISTVRLNGEIEAELHPTKIGDYDADGVSDLMVRFDRQEVIALLSAGEATLTITGKADEMPFEGTDTIRVIGKRTK